MAENLSNNLREKCEQGPYSPNSDLSGATIDGTYDPEAASKRSNLTWFRRFSRSLKPDPKIVQIEEIQTRKLEDCPGGYPRLGAFLSSESSFSIYRGFRYLHARLLLDLQADIDALERKLDSLDRLDSRTSEETASRLESKALDAATPRTDGRRSRQEIMNELREKILQYDELLIKTREIYAFQPPSQRDYRSVRTWFHNTEPLVDKECEYITKKEDVISLRSGREWSVFDGWIESTLRRFDCPLLRKIFCTQELREKTTDGDIYYYSSTRIELFVGLIITCIIFILLVLPVVAMYRLTGFGQGPTRTFDAIGVLVVFTLLFSAAMSMLTKAKRHELFAASAAYCAVLVVFISNFSGNNFGSTGGNISKAPLPY